MPVRKREGTDKTGRLFGWDSEVDREGEGWRGLRDGWMATMSHVSRLHAAPVVVKYALTARQHVRLGFLMGWRDLLRRLGGCRVGGRHAQSRIRSRTLSWGLGRICADRTR